MILYLDASALVKRYVAEAGSAEVAALIDGAHSVSTALISRAEVAAALAKAVRVGFATPGAAAAGLADFEADWPDLIRLDVNEAVVARAASVAWQQGLRGYDAVHLASALRWQEALGDPVTVATYDRELWRGARASGLVPWPADLS
ncbi:type II toxin-antitoxin system VapC family toxin [Accumulibacter sp.]|uniref:type II toxin-antitoxin system VapC family toxin n=1 Tax=Accumulibacter sp. TaxID=2053492 RepID=UPI0025D27FA6|nr:type II toxin-antitoxin system VapC family toxin [Accumulibacter sp.]MCM8614130.1 type II toxin-antitoxin system VapC family toxin [Accumulibacter sp.]MCM8637846.1 type II toxin-antitoxin system VapC family toxin [Accumulibacter sp.]MCM8641253.1 type II toxin-antitoxin system VapC family toxin [Accumulibacter sp.]